MEETEDKSATELNLDAEAAPVIKLISLILLRAAQSVASDIHI